MKHPILALHGAKESCQSPKKVAQMYLDFRFDNGRICRSRANPAKDRLPTTATKSIPRNRGGIGQPITSASIPSAFLNDSYSWHACRSRLKSGTLFTCDQRFVLQKRKARQCESISHCALEKPHSVKKPQAPNFRKLALRAPG